MKKALIVQGGWEGHHPKEVADILGGQLGAHDFDVTISDTLDSFKDLPLETFDLIVPDWTMGKIANEQLKPLLAAIESGVGVGGIHGGMGDSFRDSPDYQFMVGGQWVAHPGGDTVTYRVHFDGVPSPITAGLEDFSVTTEQYYMHVDPVNVVLATTRFGDTVMPVTWTKHYGKGRVFYCSLGHRMDVLQMPVVLEMVTRGLLWASEKD